MTTRSLACISLSMSLWAMTAASAGAQGQIQLLPAPQGQKGFGSCTVLLHDLDNDGVRDLLIGSRDSPDVYIKSGRTRKDLLTKRAPGSPVSFGRSAALLGDVNGNGAPDYAIAAPAEKKGSGVGVVYVYDGKFGNLLRTHQAPAGAQAFGTRVFRLGDLDRDSVDDYGILESAKGAANFVELFSCRSGSRP